MKKIKPRTIVTVLLLVIFFGSVGGMGYKAYQYWQGDKDYQQAEQLVQLPDLTQIPEPPVPSEDSSAQALPLPSEENKTSAPKPVYIDPYAEALANMDFQALRQKNPDILGWIIIPNTRVSYPVVQGADNEYYLDHTWRGSRNSVGAIFMEWKCSSDLSDYNTIIYGHRANNRSMFGSLLNYNKLGYYSEHPKFYITDDNGAHVYEIFAAYEVAVQTPTFWLDISREEDKQAFIDFCLEQSEIDTGVIPTVNDQIVTLSTCTGEGHDTRWVVQGVKWGEKAADVPQLKPELPVQSEVPEMPEASEVPTADIPQEEQIPPAVDEGEKPAVGPQPSARTEAAPPAVQEPAPEDQTAPVPDGPSAEGETGGESGSTSVEESVPNVSGELTPEEKYLQGVDWENTPPEIKKIILEQIETEYERRERYKK